jgi:hypothetical protein
MKSNLYHIIPGDLSDHTRLIQDAMDHASVAGGGTVVFGPGLYRSGTIHLRSHVHVHMEIGANWKASDRLEDFLRIRSPIPSRLDHQPWAAFISGIEVEDIRIDGHGSIDGNGAAPAFQTGLDDDPRRPYGLFLVGCRNVAVADLALRDSAFWMQRYLGCRGVHLSGLKIWNHANNNNDGMDIDSSEDVTISDCVIDSSDDGIVLKSEGPRPCRNVVVTNCRVATFASGFKLGTGSLTGFENIVLSNCVFHNSRSKVMAHTLKVWEGISAIDLACTDGGFLRNVAVSNVVIDGYTNAIFMRLGNRHSRSLAADQDPVAKDDHPLAKGNAQGLPPVEAGTFEHVRLSGINARNVGPIACNIVGYEGHPIRYVSLSDIDVVNGRSGCQDDLDKTPNWDSSCYPCTLMYTSNWPRFHGLPASGLVLRHAEGISLRNVRFEPVPGDPRPLYFCEHTRNLTMDGRHWIPKARTGDPG